MEARGIANLAQVRKGCDRKAAIVAALYRCMARQGYAATSLSDIAEEADMSSSHLLYYFTGREAILCSFFEQATRQLEAELTAIDEADPGQRMGAIADIMVNPAGYAKGEQGVRLDLFGQAVQNRDMRRIRVAHDRKVLAVLVELYEQTGCSPGTSPSDAARSAYAMVMGLWGSSFYDKSVCPAEANRLFRMTLYRLAGMEPQVAVSRRKSA